MRAIRVVFPVAFRVWKALKKLTRRVVLVVNLQDVKGTVLGLGFGRGSDSTLL